MNIVKGEFLGTLSSSFGKNGQIKLKFNPDFCEKLEKTECLLVEIDRQNIPFFIESIDFKNRQIAVIKFFDYDFAWQVERFVGCKVYFEDRKKKNKMPDGIKGFSVTDINHGIIGFADDFIDIENNPLIRVMNEKKEILIPASEAIIIEIDRKKKNILVNLPDGLIEINN